MIDLRNGDCLEIMKDIPDNTRLFSLYRFTMNFELWKTKGEGNGEE